MRLSKGGATLVSAAAVALAASVAPAARAEVVLPSLLSQGCVLQQKAPVRIWGTADPNEKVTVRLQNKTGTATTGPDGRWQVVLKDLKAGGPFVLTAQGASNTVTVQDVLVGEVWVCSGQSNMEWPLASTDGAPVEIAGSEDPQLRMFTVAKRVSTTPQDDVAGGQWQSASPATSGGFSAVGYYFAKSLRQVRKVPIGMINASWGGTRIEPWISRAGLQAADTPATAFAWLEQTAEEEKVAVELYQEQIKRYRAAGMPSGSFNDPGIAAQAKGWEALDLDTSAWGTIAAPGTWDEAGKPELAAIDGGVWYRREVEVPEALAGKEALLALGAVDDMDQTWVNGVKVGSTGAETPNFWVTPRRYTVPAGVLKAGRNVVAVRVWDHAGGGGITGPANLMRLTAAGAADSDPGIPLSGEWRYKIEVTRPAMPSAPLATKVQNTSALYNGMIAPLTPYAIRGAIWYQGESNAWEAGRYRTLMPALIQDWRNAFRNPNFPFFMVQLAPYKADNPKGFAWPELREAQNLTAQLLPNVGVAVITDVGDLEDIHPRNKKPVGERLALWARRVAYGEKVVAQGPVIRDFDRNTDNISVIFDGVGGGLEARGERGRLIGWEIAGGDGKYYPAEAVIQGKNQVIVASPQVRIPFHVRYGWANFAVGNLYNKEGLPASPFRTDVPLIPVEGK